MRADMRADTLVACATHLGNALVATFEKSAACAGLGVGDADIGGTRSHSLVGDADIGGTRSHSLDKSTTTPGMAFMMPRKVCGGTVCIEMCTDMCA